MGMEVKREEVWLVQLNPTQGSEISKIRPCLIVSPTEINQFLNTVLAAPMTSSKKNYPTRIDTIFQGTSGQIALDQLRAVDKSRLIQRLGILEKTTCKLVFLRLQELFAA